MPFYGTITGYNRADNGDFCMIWLKKVRENALPNKDFNIAVNLQETKTSPGKRNFQNSSSLVLIIFLNQNLSYNQTF